jgi:hypothetical protein
MPADRERDVPYDRAHRDDDRIHRLEIQHVQLPLCSGGAPVSLWWTVGRGGGAATPIAALMLTAATAKAARINRSALIAAPQHL